MSNNIDTYEMENEVERIARTKEFGNLVSEITGYVEEDWLNADIGTSPEEITKIVDEVIQEIKDYINEEMTKVISRHSDFPVEQYQTMMQYLEFWFYQNSISYTCGMYNIYDIEDMDWELEDIGGEE